MKNPSSLIPGHVCGKDQRVKQGNTCVSDLQKGGDFITHLQIQYHFNAAPL